MTNLECGIITTDMRDKLNMIYQYFTYKFGRHHQREKLYEECSEYKDAFIFGENPIEEEIADVFILSTQFYLNDPEVRKQVRYKLKRTLKRIGNGYYENMRTVQDKTGRAQTSSPEPDKV